MLDSRRVQVVIPRAGVLLWLTRSPAEEGTQARDLRCGNQRPPRECIGASDQREAAGQQDQVGAGRDDCSSDHPGDARQRAISAAAMTSGAVDETTAAHSGAGITPKWTIAMAAYCFVSSRST